ncbi:Trypsin-4 [Folsomia candida]|uniref:Trypsin-4 n=1 Tax=Folsomia candida TaxID=158441 RepID=A0A226D3S6_FOLCA|nr:Trypsin-4 [Folsomia candida]
MKLLSPLPPMVISWVANLINVEGHPANLTIEEQEKNFRIVGGRPATIGEFPYQVSVQTYGSHVCGGSLISDRHVLTVASLTNQASPSSLSVRAGSSFRGRGGQVIKVQRICQDPSYYPRNNDHDDAVLLLHKFQLQFGSRDPVHQSRQARFQTSGRNVTGWGGSLPSQLQVVEVPMVSEADCKAAYGQSAITNTMQCAGYSQGGKDACQVRGAGIV